MSLNIYSYLVRPTDRVGTPILTSSTTPVTAIDQDTPGVVFSGVDISQLNAAPYNYDTTYPLMVKMFCSEIVTDSTGAFRIKIEGSMAGNTTTFQRQDTENFALTWYQNGLVNWTDITSGDATVSVQSLSSITQISMNCVLGIATNNIDRPEQN
jgi:hypothetical protein